MMTEQKKRFCDEYIIDLNRTQAALRAGYSKKTAYSQGQRLLKDVEIQARIDKINKNREKRTQITADMVIKELSNVAFISESDFYHDNGVVKLLSELTTEQKRALQSFGFKSIPIGDGEYLDVPVFKAQDKMKALEMLGKHFGIFEKDNSQKQDLIIIGDTKDLG